MVYVMLVERESQMPTENTKKRTVKSKKTADEKEKATSQDKFLDAA